MPYSFIKEIVMFHVRESGYLIFLEVKHSLSNHLSGCFFLFFFSGLLRCSECRDISVNRSVNC